ncbi:variable surface protein Vir12-related [Plasmodium vivax]|uniref:Variable surface protein Vir12-related n=1 Tax=Plasmodium vivax (strain Salvador I) TaxID=126793 RepID=A5KC93_PLAVS|nr:variable surface protein Vir12-related [Plasmodium vivax]EDL42957.1 variable surface protein Vir12-related [Plasmodium vivax]|eukprot:XP_001612684.1 variable surface protein Vir12-related [Plasmodium vivax Sal-1]
MPLSDANNWEKHFPNLPAYQKYKELNEVDITGYNNDKCDKLAKSDDGDKKLCKQILKNLSVLKTKKGEEQERGCYYFQNWLHDQIKGKYYNGKEKTNKYPIIANKIFDLVAEDISSGNIHQACSGNSFGTLEIWKKDKDLHDYFENFEKIKCNDTDRDECQKYVNYVKYIDPMYDAKIDDCCDEDDLYPFCVLPVKCDEKYDTKKLLDELKRKLQALDKKKADADAAAQEEAKAKQAEAEKAKQLEEDRKQAEKEKAKQLEEERRKAQAERDAQEAENRKKAAAAAAEARKKELAAAANREKQLAATRGGQQTVRGDTGALQPEPSLGVPPRDSHEDSVNAATTYNSGISGDAGHASLAGVPSSLESVSDMVDSNFIRNIIMAVAVLGTIFFLFYYNRSSRLESSLRKKKRKKGKIFEHNYYEEYEKELEMYGSEETFLDSEADRFYLNYHPDQDSYYTN